MEDFAKKELKEESGVPVCEKCGNVMIKESSDLSLDSSEEIKESKNGEWVCPHCQGEIDFLGEDDE